MSGALDASRVSRDNLQQLSLRLSKLPAVSPSRHTDSEIVGAAMPKIRRTLLLGFSFLMCAAAAAGHDASRSLVLQKFQDDVKTAAANGAVTPDQVKQVQESIATLKAYNISQKPAAPIDLLTPYHAVSALKVVAGDPNLKPADRKALQQDLALVVNSIEPGAPATPSAAGPHLAADVLKAILNGNPNEDQVKQLQESLTRLQQGMGVSEGRIAQAPALKKAKVDIAEIINSSSFRDPDRQAVLEDLNALGPRGAKLDP
jgi:hypothetical protein